MKYKLLLIFLSIFYIECSSFKLVTSSNDYSELEINSNPNDENSAYYGKYEFFLDIPVTL